MLRITHTRGPLANTTTDCVFTPVRLGALAEADISYPNGSAVGVAPRHADIRFENGVLFIVDHGTPGGTYVRGARVAQQILQSGDRIAFGHPQAGPEFAIEVRGGLVERPADVDADGRVDLATAQRIVQSAVAQAVSKPDRSTALVQQNLQQASKRGSCSLTLLTLGAVALIFASLGVFLYAKKSNDAAEVLAEEAGLGKKAKKVDGKIPERVLTGREIYEQNKDALYVIGYIDGNKIGGCCTAFAVSSRLLATNAHCLVSCTDKGARPIVIRNDSQGKIRINIVATEKHPKYKHDENRSQTPDVGLIKVASKMSSTVTLANEAELLSIGPGDDAYVLGFPGRVMDPTDPSATFLQGRIGRTTDFKNRAVSSAGAVLIQHDAVTRGGNSGSPIFNQYGHVIGIHTAHIDEESEVSIDGKKTQVLEASPFRLGMRIDLLSGVDKP